MFKHLKRTALPQGLITGVILGLAAAMPAQAQQSAKLSYHWGPKHPASAFANEFAERITERSDGALSVQVFPSGQLFGIRDVLGGVSSGAVQIGMAVGVVSFPPLNKNYYVTTLPGVFGSYDEIRGFFDETEAGRGIMDDITSSAGIEIVGYNPVGPSALFTTRENVTSIKDYEGVSARVLSDSERPQWEAFNAGRMVSLPTSEVYTALQSGMVDTVSTVPGAIESYSWWDYFKTAQLPYSQFNDAYIIANAAWLDSLTPEMRTLVEEVGAEISQEATAAIMEASMATLKTFEEMGGSIVTFDGDALEELRMVERDQILPQLMENLDPDVAQAALDYVGSQ
ncbi:TRAP transporter substrate-binding protein [Pseudooceanicola aestuarii]|uniref:TRAP transporter substrate-binding protein n=1 Tax=Pseudooceanicola aestuarii TaxID=2697319 RepID=UPI0013D470A0|nr:TRAP transporter substrate-binding protein [Pseudooceanicola aestuarii]